MHVNEHACERLLQRFYGQEGPYSGNQLLAAERVIKRLVEAKGGREWRNEYGTIIHTTLRRGACSDSIYLAIDADGTCTTCAKSAKRWIRRYHMDKRQNPGERRAG